MQQAAGREDRARELLHQAWGAYWETRPHFTKLIEQMRTTPSTERWDLVERWLRLHQSTAERINDQEAFWKVAGATEGSYLDYGCGLMPLAYALAVHRQLMPAMPYEGVDIDIDEVVFINQLTELLNIQHYVTARVGDIVTDSLPAPTVSTPRTILLLKLIPLLDHQIGVEKTIELVRSHEAYADRLVISFPTRSIGGVDKGMAATYRARYAAMLAGYEVHGLPSELLYTKTTADARHP